MVSCEFECDAAVQIYMALTARIRALRKLVADNDGDDNVLTDLAAAEVALDTISKASQGFLASDGRRRLVNQPAAEGSEDTTTYWVRVPGPGQFRGEGEWVRADRVTYDSAENWLPTHEGPRPPTYLVDFLADAAKTDTSVIRRAIVEGAVTVNSQVIEDPAHRLDLTPLKALFVEYAGNGYPYYPYCP